MSPPTFTLIRFRRTASTQDWVRAWARLGAGEGLAVQALEQTAGRGRLQRSWWSPHGTGLYISVLLRPDLPAAQANQLTMLVSLAAIDACQTIAGITPRPKWPNDLLFDGRKLAGVLTELEIREGRLQYAIIGLGLNVNMRFSGTPLADTALSLAEITGGPFSVDALRAAYLAALGHRYARFLAGESPHAAWRENLEPLGRRVRIVQQNQSSIEGVAIDVDPGGALLVEDHAGVVHTIWAGDVVIL